MTKEISRSKVILDACCGSKMFWFNKNHPNVHYCDNREVPRHEYYPKRYIEIKPDTVCDFTNLPFEDNTFKLVVFDPPHLTWAGPKSWMAMKYGCLDENWPDMIHDGFHECMRVLDNYGTLIFKWSEVQIPLKDVLKAIQVEPLFGHRSGKHNNTHWLAFMKMPQHTCIYCGMIWTGGDTCPRCGERVNNNRTMATETKAVVTVRSQDNNVTDEDSGMV